MNVGPMLGQTCLIAGFETAHGTIAFGVGLVRDGLPMNFPSTLLTKNHITFVAFDGFNGFIKFILGLFAFWTKPIITAWGFGINTHAFPMIPKNNFKKRLFRFRTLYPK